MKKIIWSILAILLACSILGFASFKLNNPSVETKRQDLIIYNWGDYLDPKLIKKFEKQTGYHVVYETFDSNEAMYTKIKQGGTNYDIAVPSEYMVMKMKKNHLLDTINRKKIPNLKYLSSAFLNQNYDRHNQYSIPYFWGTLGIVYNDRLVKKSNLTNWNDLWNKKFNYQILLVDSARDAMGMSLASLGYSMNSRSNLQLKLAQTKLEELAPNIKAIISDEIKMYMVQNEAPLAVTWSGEAHEMMDNNSHLHYLIPAPSSNLWIDNLVIPRTAKNKKGAYQFINFMLKPENAAINAKYVGYATPNEKARQLLPKAIKDNPAFYPNKAKIKNLQIYQDLGSRLTQEYNDLFLEFKMYTH